MPNPTHTHESSERGIKCSLTQPVHVTQFGSNYESGKKDDYSNRVRLTPIKVRTLVPRGLRKRCFRALPNGQRSPQPQLNRASLVKSTPFFIIYLIPDSFQNTLSLYYRFLVRVTKKNEKKTKRRDGELLTLLCISHHSLLSFLSIPLQKIPLLQISTVHFPLSPFSLSLHPPILFIFLLHLLLSLLLLPL